MRRCATWALEFTVNPLWRHPSVFLSRLVCCAVKSAPDNRSGIHARDWLLMPSKGKSAACKSVLPFPCACDGGRPQPLWAASVGWKFDQHSSAHLSGPHRLSVLYMLEATLLRNSMRVCDVTLVTARSNTLPLLTI